MDLDAEKVVFAVKIMDLDAKMFAEKAMVAFILRLMVGRRYSFSNIFDKSGYNGTISDCCAGA